MVAEPARAFVFEAGDLPSGLYLIRARGEAFIGVLSGYVRKPATSQGWLKELALQDLGTIPFPSIKTRT